MATNTTNTTKGTKKTITDFNSLPNLIRIPDTRDIGGDKSRYKDIGSIKAEYSPAMPKNNFINATLLNLKPLNEDKFIKYIATQCPIPNTIKDFWKMINKHNVRLIVQIGKNEEMSKGKKVEKCLDYITNTPDLTYDDDEKKDKHTVDGGFKCVVKRVKISNGNIVYHVQYEDWPDHGVPGDSTSFIQFLLYIAKFRATLENKYGQFPMVVHCSAGVGRTGVFITSDVILHSLGHNLNLTKVDKSLDDLMYHTVADMRTRRTLMVQTEDQYMFIRKVGDQLIQEYQTITKPVQESESPIQTSSPSEQTPKFDKQYFEQFPMYCKVYQEDAETTDNYTFINVQEVKGNGGQIQIDHQLIDKHKDNNYDASSNTAIIHDGKTKMKLKLLNTYKAPEFCELIGNVRGCELTTKHSQGPLKYLTFGFKPNKQMATVPIVNATANNHTFAYYCVHSIRDDDGFDVNPQIFTIKKNKAGKKDDKTFMDEDDVHYKLHDTLPKSKKKSKKRSRNNNTSTHSQKKSKSDVFQRPPVDCLVTGSIQGENKNVGIQKVSAIDNGIRIGNVDVPKYSVEKVQYQRVPQMATLKFKDSNCEIVLRLLGTDRISTFNMLLQQIGYRTYHEVKKGLVEELTGQSKQISKLSYGLTQDNMIYSMNIIVKNNLGSHIKYYNIMKNNINYNKQLISIPKMDRNRKPTHQFQSKDGIFYTLKEDTPEQSNEP